MQAQYARSDGLLLLAKAAQAAAAKARAADAADAHKARVLFVLRAVFLWRRSGPRALYTLAAYIENIARAAGEELQPCGFTVDRYGVAHTIYPRLELSAAWPLILSHKGRVAGRKRLRLEVFVAVQTRKATLQVWDAGSLCWSLIGVNPGEGESVGAAALRALQVCFAEYSALSLDSGAPPRRVWAVAPS
jgi:hypothetical protein